MAENSKIAWTTHTFNPWIGCTRVPPGCENCYAEDLMADRHGRVKWGPNRPRSRTKTWKDPVKWDRSAAARNATHEQPSRPRVFCASLADWLDHEVPVDWLGELLALVRATPNLDRLMLTKRIELWEDRLQNVVRHTHGGGDEVASAWPGGGPPPNVWLGVTAENQKYWDLRVPLLKNTPAALRWVSYEPSLGPLRVPAGSGVDWVIAGGESSQSAAARPFDLAWAAGMIADCREHGAAPFVKQLGSNAWVGGRPYPTKDKAGADPAEWPGDVRVREFPTSPASGRGSSTRKGPPP